MTKIAIFIEPQAKLKTSLSLWKKKVEESLPGQPYCSHPPHCTLIHANVMSEDLIDQKICQTQASLSAPQVQVSGTDVFWDDAATGGHTLYLKITPKSELLDLQLRLAKAIRSEVLSKEVPAFVKNNSNLKNSYDQYGFPFVGSHWIPHFSIASLRTERSHPLITEFLRWQPVYEFTLGELSLWRIESDEHTLIKNYELSV